MIVAAGAGATKHFSSYHRLLNTASWSLDSMGLAVFTILGPLLGEVVMLGLDSEPCVRALGTQLGGSRSDGGLPVSPGALDLPAAALSAVRQSAGRGRAWWPVPHPARTGHRDASHLVFRPRKQAVPWRGIGGGDLRHSAGIPARWIRRSATYSVRCDGPACGSTFWKGPRVGGVPENWPDSSKTRSRWRRDSDAFGPSSTCFVLESEWSREGVPMT